jgi:hypothetical protein
MQKLSGSKIRKNGQLTFSINFIYLHLDKWIVYNAMTQKVVNSLALFFVFVGLLGIVEFMVELYQSRIHLGLRFLLLPAGIGLLYKRELWRKFAVFVMYLFAAVLAAISIAYFAQLQRIGHFFGQLPPIDLIYAALLVISLVIVIVVSIGILEHRDVKALFQSGTIKK